MDDKRKPWEQLPDEPSAAYARFVVYLNLGRTRSLESAYLASEQAASNRVKSRRGARTRKTERASGQWAKDCATYHWVERALAKDIDDLTSKGYETVVDFVNILAVLANKTLIGLANPKVKPRSIKAILELVNTLGSFIPAETVAAIRADAERHRASAIGHNDGASGSGGAGADSTQRDLPGGPAAL